MVIVVCGLAAVLLLVAAPAAAQVTLYGFQQYSWGSTLPASGSNVPGQTAGSASPADVQISRKVQLGVAVTVDVSDRVAVEFMWMRHALEAQVGTEPDQTELPLHLRTSSYLGHVLYRLRPKAHKPRWTPFVFAGLGRTSVIATTPDHVWTFDAGAGATLALHGPRLGLRAQGRIAPMPAAGAPRTVYGRGNTGTYQTAATSGAYAAELYIGVTTTF